MSDLANKCMIPFILFAAFALEHPRHTESSGLRGTANRAKAGAKNEAGVRLAAEPVYQTHLSIELIACPKINITEWFRSASDMIVRG